VVHARHRPVIEDLKRQRREQVRSLKEGQRDELQREDLLPQAVASRLRHGWADKDAAPPQERTRAQRAEEVRRGLDGTDGPSPVGPSRARRMRRS
jgi:hypothetical protein